MKVYGQIVYESGPYAILRADEFTQWESVKDAKQSLAACWNDFDVDPAGGQGVTLLLWKGEPEKDDLFPCDFSAVGLADYVFELGPRCGVRKAY